MIRVPPTFSRRALLVGGAAAAAATACAGTSNSSDESVEPLEGASGQFFLQAGFADGLRSPAFLVAGREQTVPLVVTDDTGRPLQLDETPATIELRIERDGAVVSTQTLPTRGEGVLVPHYSALIAVDEPGPLTAFTEVDGQTLSFDFAVGDPADVAYLGVGDTLSPVATPTFDEPRDVDPICTFLPDPCPFHDVSLDSTLAADKPIVFLIATPAFCQTSICGPVVQMLIDRFEGTDETSVVHTEVWKNADVVLTTDGLADAVQAFELGHEPALWIADATGTITARLDFAWDVNELNTALATAGL